MVAKHIKRGFKRFGFKRCVYRGLRIRTFRDYQKILSYDLSELAETAKVK